MNVKQLLIFFSVLLVTACKDSSKQPQTETPKQEVPELLVTAPKVQTFKDIPSEILDCSCLFSSSKDTYESQQYIYADDNSIEFAQLIISNKTEKFKSTSYKRTTDNHFIKTWENDRYKVIFDIIENDDENEQTETKGTLIVTDKTSGLNSKTPIYGLCAC